MISYSLYLSQDVETSPEVNEFLRRFPIRFNRWVRKDDAVRCSALCTSEKEFSFLLFYFTTEKNGNAYRFKIKGCPLSIAGAVTRPKPRVFLQMIVGNNF